MSRILSTAIEVQVTITISDEAPVDVISRCFTDEWRDNFYDMSTEDDVIAHLAYNAAINGVIEIERLDGWGDVPRGMVRMEVEHFLPAEPEAETGR